MSALLLSLMFSLHWINIFQLTSIDTYGITMGDACAISMILYALYICIWLGRPLTFIPGSITMLFFLILLTEYTSIINPILSADTSMQMQFLKTSTNFLYKWLYTFVFVAGIFSAKDAKKALVFILYFSVFINVFGLYQMFARAFDLPFAWIEINNVTVGLRNNITMDGLKQLSLNFDNFFRATSLFSEPSILGHFNALIITLITIPYIKRRPQLIHSKVQIITILILALIGMLIAFSLTGITILIMILLYILLFEQSNRKSMLGLVSGILAGILLIIDRIIYSILNTSIIELFAMRFGGIYNVLSTSGAGSSSIQGESFFSRMETSMQGIGAWFDNPLTGLGAGCLFAYSKTDSIPYTDALYTGLIGELGIFGFVVFMLFIVMLYLKIKQCSHYYTHNNVLNSDTDYVLSLAPYFLILMAGYGLAGYSWITFDHWTYIGFVFIGLISVYKENSLPLKEVYLVSSGLKYRIAISLGKSESQ